MDSSTVLNLMYITLLMAAKLCAPLLLTSLLVGLLVSLFQAVTQINDATLGFLPKVVTVLLVLYACWPWLAQEMISYTTHIFALMEQVPR